MEKRVCCRDCRRWLWRDDVAQYNDCFLTVCFGNGPEGRDGGYSCGHGEPVESAPDVRTEEPASA